jgi:CelD/BcsL family acetyltransferase involved in cellulose biosynthesis
MGGSFDDYLGGMGGKSRNTLRRKVRQLEKRKDGVEIRRVHDPSQVPEFLEAAAEISKNSWQQRVLGDRLSDDERTRQSLSDLAGRGLLRSYLLISGSDPTAFLIGYQYRGVFNSGELGYDQRYSDYSPGTVLWYLLLEDLHGDPSMTLLNFGMGDAAYKRRFGNDQSSDASWLVMRRSPRNRLLARTHAAFDGSVEVVKKIIGRRVGE